ncbi:MAG: lysophospholipid acyltransferase family protein, partial [Butyrivibrio sp.]|nr:lysophospholipid acyltransferase family protein [Butyrivibrio sp.]
VDEEEAERIAKASCVNLGYILFEVLRFPVIKDNIKEYVTIEGLEYMTKEGVSGKGGVLATAHCDNWELFGSALAQAGIPLVGVAKKQKSSGMDRFINEYRTMMGMHITYSSGVREMFRMMSEGWIIGLIMDQDSTPHDGILLEFFGQVTNFVTGAAAMGRSRNVPIFIGFMHRNPDGTHHMKIGKPIMVNHTEDKREDIRMAIQKIADLTEEHIRKYPEEWFWLHDRWKSVRVEPESFGDELRQAEERLKNH